MTSASPALHPANRIVQGLWIGSELSIMEQLSVASFLRNGHEYHLYTYGDVANVPKGATVRDASGVIHESRIFQYRHHRSFSAFANFFRYKLLLEKGGWWADTDTICLRPFDLAREYVFSSEAFQSSRLVNCGVVKVPVASAVMSYAWNVCQAKQPEQLVWGEVGPRLMAESVSRLALEEYVMTPRAFCPIDYREWDACLDPARTWRFGDEVYAVHLWNEMWRRNERDKNQAYHQIGRAHV